jgi:hypothetical protein
MPTVREHRTITTGLACLSAHQDPAVHVAQLEQVRSALAQCCREVRLMYRYRENVEHGGPPAVRGDGGSMRSLITNP